VIFDISKALPNKTVYNGKTYRLNLTLSNVLKVYGILHEDEILSEEINAFALALLVKEKNPPPLLLEHIFNEYISITKKSSRSTELRIVDFRQDGIYLYSSFLQDYGIDLVKESRHMHWWKFVSLFQGLSEKTKMREVMRIRCQKIPESNKNNNEYIANLIELKQYYALELSQSERETNFKHGLAGLAETLKAKAKA